MPLRRPTRWTAALLFSGGAFLSFLTRAFIDFRYVHAELGYTGAAFIWMTLAHLAFYGGWVAALVAASHRRRGAMYVLAGYAVLLVLFGFVTSTTFCPSPCRTAWPLGEIAIWSNYLLGIPAVALAALSLWGRERSP